MTIRIEVIGETAESARAQVLQLAEMFGISGAEPQVQQTYEESFSATVTDAEPPKSKRGRKKKEAAEALAIDAPFDAEPEVEEEVADEPAVDDGPFGEEPAPALDPEALAKLREACITRIKQIYLEPGGVDKVTSLVRRFGEGKTTKVLELPPDVFPAIAVEIGVGLPA